MPTKGLWRKQPRRIVVVEDTVFQKMLTNRLPSGKVNLHAGVTRLFGKCGDAAVRFNHGITKES